MAAKIYLTTANDGWYNVPGETETKTFRIDLKKRGIKEFTKPVLHFFYKGKSMCGKYDGIPDGSHHQTTSHHLCDKCLPGVRALTAKAFALRDANDESENVIDYKAVTAKDKPESATSGN